MFGKTTQRLEELTFEVNDLKAEVLKARMELRELLKEVRTIKLSRRKKRRPAITQKSGYKKVSKEEAEGMYEMYKNGGSLVDIAARFERSPSTVSHHIDKFIEKETKNED